MLLFDSQLFDGPQISGGWLRRPGQPLTYTGVSYLVADLQPGFLFVQPSSPSWSSRYVENKPSMRLLQKRGVSTILTDTVPDFMPEGMPVYVCPDTRLALAQLAEVVRSRIEGPLVCITGSVGKTTVKTGVTAMLSCLAPTHSSLRNLNHYQGVLVSLASYPQEASYGVLEFSSDLPHYTLPKALIARPDLAVITDIQLDHTDCYPSLEAIADQKSLLFRGLRPGGSVVLNRDSPYYSRLLAAALSFQSDLRVVSFGTTALADVSLLSWEATSAEGSLVEVDYYGRKLAYSLALSGRHNVMNSLAMLAVFAGLDLEPEPCLPALANLQSLPRRCRIERITLPNGGVISLLDDSFSSNPASVLAALDALALQSAGQDGRKLLVLGDMGIEQDDQLGSRSHELHASLADIILRSNVDRIYAHGSHVRHVCDMLPNDMLAINTLDERELQAALLSDLQPGDWLVLKTSGYSTLSENLLSLLRGL